MLVKPRLPIPIISLFFFRIENNVMKRKASDPFPSKEFISRFRVPSSLKELQRVTPFSKPVELSHFSFDANRRLLLNNSSSLACLDKSVKLPLDLNIGYPNDYITREPTPEGLSALVRSLQSLGLEEGTRKKADFITWRGIMTKIITCPYSLRDDWKLFGIKRGGTIYLFEDDLDAERQANKYGGDGQQKLFTYYGYKAESLLTRPLGTDKNNNSVASVVNTNVQYCSVFETKLGSHRLIMGAEVDCLENEVTDRNQFQKQYLEIKTHKVIRNANQDRSFKKFKCLKTWAQSYLAGIPKVLFAFRDEQGTLQKLEMYETMKFPRLARPENMWDPNVCLTFGSKVLDFIKETIHRDDKNLIYRICYDSNNQDISISEPFENKEINKMSL